LHWYYWEAGTFPINPVFRPHILSQWQDNPLHIALFPPHKNKPNAQLEFSFILNSSLDIFDLRARDKSRVDQDLGLLHAIDERLSVWGWETGTGTKFAIVLDMWGQEGVEGTGLGIREAELKPVTSSASLELVLVTNIEPNAGVPGSSTGLHQASSEPILQARRARAECGHPWCPWRSSYHKPQIRCGGRADRDGVETGSYFDLTLS
jgi:hypothetical protein